MTSTKDIAKVSDRCKMVIKFTETTNRTGKCWLAKFSRPCYPACCLALSFMMWIISSE